MSAPGVTVITRAATEKAAISASIRANRAIRRLVEATARGALRGREAGRGDGPSASAAGHTAVRRGGRAGCDRRRGRARRGEPSKRRLRRDPLLQRGRPSLHAEGVVRRRRDDGAGRRRGGAARPALWRRLPVGRAGRARRGRRDGWIVHSRGRDRRVRIRHGIVGA